LAGGPSRGALQSELDDVNSRLAVFAERDAMLVDTVEKLKAELARSDGEVLKRLVTTQTSRVCKALAPVLRKGVHAKAAEQLSRSPTKERTAKPGASATREEMMAYSNSSFLADHAGPLNDLLSGLMSGEDGEKADKRSRRFKALAIAAIHCGGHPKFNWTMGKILSTRVHCLTSSTRAVDSIACYIPGALSRTGLMRSLLREADECAAAGGTIEEEGTDVLILADNNSGTGYARKTSRLGTEHKQRPSLTLTIPKISQCRPWRTWTQ
jgi:hypothetical protein